MICTHFACFNTCMIYLSSLPPLCVCRQDALSMESNRVNTEREVEGSQYYDVEIDSARCDILGICHSQVWKSVCAVCEESNKVIHS